jgi:DNA polymerase-1
VIVTTTAQLKEVVAIYSEFDSLAFDVETKGPDRVNPRRNEVFWLSLAGPGRADAIPMGHPLGEIVDWEVALRKDGQPRKGAKPKPIYGKPPKQLSPMEVFDALRPVFFSDRRKVGHNVKFDIESTAKYYGEAIPPPYDDTALLAYLVNENHTGNKPYGLGSVVKREFDYVYEKSLGRIGVETFPFKQAARYSYHDSKYTWLAFQSLLKQVEHEGVLSVYELEAELLECVVDMESTGVPINTEELQKLDKELAAQIKETEERLYEANGGEFNLNADRQVAELLFEKRGHEPRVFTPKQQLPSVASGALAPFLKDPVVRDFLHWDELKKLHSTYVIGILDQLHDGRLHADFDQRGARTGRFSARKPALQTIPTRRSKQIRGLFVAN